MIIIADSGSTKTDWCLVDRSGEQRLRTAGMNPYFQSEEEMHRTLQEELLPALGETSSVEALFFYGAGCAVEQVNQRVSQLLASHFPGKIEVQSDLMAAARALCGHEAGIACILGTGSNSCAYDGEQITEQVSSLGYVLGDEGSGSVLGKRLVGDVVKHQLPREIEELFYAETGLTVATILEKVYRQPFPNRFLASLVPFVKAHMEEPPLRALVEDNFRAFFVRNVRNYALAAASPVHFVGSIAYHFQAQLSQVAEEQGFRLGRISQSPLEGLIHFHASREQKHN